jgi:predicted N-acetyltransferase YhbS
MSDVDVDILDLKQAPQFMDQVADRIWREWWRPEGRTLGAVEAALRDVVEAEDYPFTLVAASEGQFLGTVTSIASDISARPELGPCLAALWVEPQARGRGIGAALIAALTRRLSALGHDRVYLSAKPKMRSYYLLRGWTMIDGDIDKDHQDVYLQLLN